MHLSGTLSPELGRLSYMQILDFMWNNITGSIPKEIGNITTLELLLLNGNKLTGSLPEELGNLPNLDRIQIDQNQISGSIPRSFANLNKTKHFHMNNNSISGQIPSELSRLPELVHFLLDNNNLSGYLPPEFSEMPKLLIVYVLFLPWIFTEQCVPQPHGTENLLNKNRSTGGMELSDNINNLKFLRDDKAMQTAGLAEGMESEQTEDQLDNNHFNGSIPASYSNMSKLLKLSLRNCSLQGEIPDLSKIPYLGYLDLSSNQLNGTIPPGRFSENITTMSLENNSLSGTVSSSIWQNRTSNGNETYVVDFQNNDLSNISGTLDLPLNVTVRLYGNPLCTNESLVQFCGSQSEEENDTLNPVNSTVDCTAVRCPLYYEISPASLEICLCAAPLLVGYRLKSPGFSNFLAYQNMFEYYLTSGLSLNLDQLKIDSVEWEKGPRLKMYFKLFPDDVNNSSEFNSSEVLRIRGMFTGWNIPDSDVFGPYELINFTLTDIYKDGLSQILISHDIIRFRAGLNAYDYSTMAVSIVIGSSSSSGISTGALVGIILGTIAVAVTLSAIGFLLILKNRLKKYHTISRRRKSTRISIKIDGVKDFTYGEMALATNNFNDSAEVGQGGYGKVYKGILADGTVVAIKRAQEGSLQGQKEFFTEIELLSRVHHRNLVSLIGYCDEEVEQMLVYEFMPNGTLRDHLSAAKSKEPLSFAMRLSIALGSSKGILYLHTEANPPIFHRDVKASNILLDSKFIAKVADFGLSRLAPVPDIEGSTPAHVSTVVKGTPGYLDPEYFLTHKLTDKSDVYSLGVVFLELLTGMHPISHGKNIVREVNVSYQSGMIFSVIDNRMGSYPSECVEKFVKLALKCCQEDTDARPSMAQVVRELENIWLMMPESDTKTTESLITEPGKLISPPSSSTPTKNPYVSSDISGSELVSGVVPTIAPR
ncbi:putative LRR receptor-like serine/threonine-protein kinase [Vitis vinifera]|uniref:non-specific serine/threonine protein kinase n=1 Tax=Vitis vinifera TaxID=29760 RepID=A0A438F8Y6_VITVI|nr:putative LRR receptor-like serine/threonine-protein kinase [Vitis vinifera]